MIETARCFFNERAELWESRITERTMSSSERLIRGLGIEAGSSVLDVGCGTGLIIPWLLEAVGGGGRVTALDVAEKMLKMARDKHWAPNVEFIHGSVEKPPFLDDSFDVVVCHNCFSHVADKPAAAREIRRVLKPGGRVAVSHTECRDSVNEMRVIRVSAARGFGLPEDGSMRSIFSRAGFVGISILDQSQGYLFQAYKQA